jgi:hypothetical protein
VQWVLKGMVNPLSGEHAKHKREEARYQRDDESLDLEEGEVAEDEGATGEAEVELANICRGGKACRKVHLWRDAAGETSLSLSFERSDRPRLPLRLRRIGTRMNSSSMRINTRQSCSFPSSSPVTIAPTNASKRIGSVCREKQSVPVRLLLRTTRAYLRQHLCYKNSPLSV